MTVTDAAPEFIEQAETLEDAIRLGMEEENLLLRHVASNVDLPLSRIYDLMYHDAPMTHTEATRFADLFGGDPETWKNLPR